jgi:transposase
VLAGRRGDRSVRDVCREHAIAETLYYGWRDKLLESGHAALAGKEERGEEGRVAAHSRPEWLTLEVRSFSSQASPKRSRPR